ncbi:IS4 family transposase, partial [Rhizobium binae]|nr:IS4 family transposase [Rhizobium binae]
VTSPLAFARLVRANLMHRRRIDRLLQPAGRPPHSPHQMSLQ